MNRLGWPYVTDALQHKKGFQGSPNKEWSLGTGHKVALSNCFPSRKGKCALPAHMHKISETCKGVCIPMQIRKTYISTHMQIRNDVLSFIPF